MTTLYLAWQDRRNRDWYPIGCLTRLETEPVEYQFEYIRGVEQAKDSANPFVIPVPGFPEIGETYRASDIFPAFRYRAMNRGRPDLTEYLESLGLDADVSDVVDELAVSGGHSVADSYEIFPAIEPSSDGNFATRFIVHGLRHTNTHSIKRVDSLKAGDRLEISFELNNPVTVHALNVKTTDHFVVGWLPRYLVDVMHGDKAWRVEDVKANVARVNPEAPFSHRLLVELTGQFPPGVDPMSELEMYQPIATSK